MMTRNRVLALLFGPLLGLVAGTGAWADPVKCGDRPIRLGFYENGFLYDKGVGINQDIVEALRNRSGCRFATKVMTRARIWADLASGDLDMSVSGLKTAERDTLFWFLDYMRMKTYAIVHNDVASRVQSAREFLHQTRLQIGVVSSLKYGGMHDPWLDQLRLADRVQETPEAESIFRKLQSHRVDVVFAQPPVYRKYLRDLAMDDLVEVQDWSPEEKGQSHGLVLSRSRYDAMDVEQWRALMEEMKREGVLRTIFLKYLPAKDADAMLSE